MATDQQNDWVTRVLGFSITDQTASAQAGRRASAPGRMPARELLALFRDAKDEVDEALNKLADAMRATGDVDFVRIADYGMYGMTNGQGVGLMKALLELQSATPDTQESLSKAARDAASRYKAVVFSHKLADLVDANPFSVPVGLKAKLGPALDTIASAA